MASSCCWLPVVLLAVGVSGAGIATALEAYRPIFIVVTFAFLAMAFYFTYRPRPAFGVAGDCCASLGAESIPPDARSLSAAPTAVVRKSRVNMMALNKAMLWVVTVLAVVFLFFPQYVTGLIGVAKQEITADMTRSVVTIDGMTCKG
jgi:hypothetical protein